MQTVLNPAVGGSFTRPIYNLQFTIYKGKGEETLTFLRTIAVVVLAGGAGYLLVRGLRAALRRLLWRVRRKLILSYVFIGFVPAILIVVFFALGGLLLFFNFSAYLVREDVQRLSDRTAWIARSAALELQQS